MDNIFQKTESQDDKKITYNTTLFNFGFLDM